MLFCWEAKRDRIQWLRANSGVAARGNSVYPHGEKRKQAMPLLQILMVLIAVGVLLWLVNNFIPMAGSIKSILNAVVVIGVIVWLLNIFGFIHSLSRVHVGA
jgi:hypothetical protein